MPTTCDDIIPPPLCRGGEVLGRCVRDVRVCHSTGRDRDNDERKVAKQQPDNPPPAKRTRKRGQRSSNVYFLDISVPLEMCYCLVLFFAAVKIFQFWPKTMDYNKAF